MHRLRTVTSLDVSAVAGHNAMPAALLLRNIRITFTCKVVYELFLTKCIDESVLRTNYGVCEAISKCLSVNNNRVAIGDSLHTTKRQLQKFKTIFLFHEARSHVMNDVITSNKQGRCPFFHDLSINIP